MEDSELKALISLLDDPDDRVYSQIKEKLIEMGEDVIPFLENAWEHDSWGITFQDRVEEIIHTIQFRFIKDSLQNWRESTNNNLLEGMILIAKYQYPDLDEQKIRDKIEQMENDVWLEFNNDLTALEKVRIINHVIFDVHGFSANTKNYHAPHNSFINEVLDSKKGNPITLAILYSIIAQRQNMPLRGVNLPRHFILAYEDVTPLTISKDNTPSILFYVNPFSRGAVFSKKEILDFLQQLNITPKDSYFKPCDTVDIIQRVFNNLIYSYEKLGYAEKVAELQELKEVIS